MTKNRANAQTEAGTLLDVAGVAAILQCSRRHVCRMAKDHLMPSALKVGALTRWRRADIERWLADGCPAVGGCAE